MMKQKSYHLYPDPSRRDDFIDFLKGISILGVIWLHCMPLQNEMLAPLWCGMSVSMFLLVQVFHAYRKGASLSRMPNLGRLVSRILIPMMMVTGALSVIQWQFGIVRHAGGIGKTLMSGGYGPGCYYPWIYIQLAFIIPLVGKLHRWLSPKKVGGAILVLSIILEVLSSYLCIPEWLWRILFFRYAFLIWLGYDVLTNGIRISWCLLLLSFLGICFILYMYLINPDISPFFIHNRLKVEHWPSYFYPAYLLLWIIRLLYERISDKICTILSKIGIASYEIFLCQMFYFALLDPSRITLTHSNLLNYLLFILFAWVFSVGVGLMWQKNKFSIMRV